MNPGTVAAIAFLALVAFAHPLPVVVGTAVTVGGLTVPMSASVVAVIVTGGIALKLWQESRR
jgi:hypothetical protein